MQVYSLFKLINEYGEANVNRWILNYYCPLNKEVENFLINKAILYEKYNIARTFFIVYVTPGRTYLLAYFTIAIKEFRLDYSLSRKMKKDIVGTGFEVNGDLSAILIVQIGKNYNQNLPISIKGSSIMQYIFSIMEDIRDLCGGRIVYVEAKEHVKLRDFYYKSGFMLYSDFNGIPIRNEHNLWIYLKSSPFGIR